MRSISIFLISIILIAACSTYTWDTLSRKVESTSIQTIDQKTVQVVKPGTIQIVHFWAFNHPLSRNSLNYLNELNEKSKKNNIELIVVCLNWSGSDLEIKEFMLRNNYSFNVVFDKENKLGSLFEVTSVPQTQIINKNGTIVNRLMGLREDLDYVNAIVSKALGK